MGGAWAFVPRFVGLGVFDAATLAACVWEGTAWASLAPRSLEASAACDPASLAAGAGVTITVTVADAALGDCARACFPLGLQGVTLGARASGANSVNARLQNGTAGASDRAGGTLRVRVEKA